MKKSSKSQSAMEYLMTYGWAILIIAVVLGALFQLGVFNSSSFSPRAPPGACQVFRPSGPGTITNINLMGVCTGQLPQYVAQFNGASSYVDLGSSTALKLTGSLSISAWIVPRSLTADNRVFADFSYMHNGYAMNVYSTGTFYFATWQEGVQQITISTTGGAVTIGNWNHIVVTRNGTAAKIYKNGVDVTGAAGSHLDPTPSTVNAWIGLGSGWPFNGFIANVQLYNNSLSANDIRSLYLEGIGGAPIKLRSLVGWWPLNGNSNDYSGNNNNGVPAFVSFTSQYGK